MQRCKGCGDALKDGSDVLALHLSLLPACVEPYRDDTLWVQGAEILRGTLHLAERLVSSGSKWKVSGLMRNGTCVRLHTTATKTKALAWIEAANKKRLVT